MNEHLNLCLSLVSLPLGLATGSILFRADYCLAGMFRDRLEQALALAGRSAQQLALMFLDLDQLRRATIPSVMRPAIICSGWSPNVWRKACARAIRWPGSAATNS